MYENEDFMNEDPAVEEAILEWFRESIPKEYVSILNVSKYSIAVNAIKHIVAFFHSNCEEDEMPNFDLSYDTVVGIQLGLTVILTEFGVQATAKQIKDTLSFLPDDCLITVIPMQDFKCRIEFTFKDVKEIP